MTGSISWDPPNERRPLRLLVPGSVRDAPDGPVPAPRLLEVLLDAMDDQWTLLEAAVDQLYDDLFIESCAPWIVPYIGALVGLPADASRREVAYAIALGRRKGTPGALEDLSEIVTGWKARLVEGWQVVAWSQRPGHPPPPRPSTLDLHWSTIDRVGGSFETSRRTLDAGRWHPRAATLLVWPWEERAYREVEVAPTSSKELFRLHPLRVDAPLHLQPTPLDLRSDADDPATREVTGTDPTLGRAADETGAPVRATWDVLEAMAKPGDLTRGASWSLAPSHPLANRGDDVPLISVRVGPKQVPWSHIRFAAVPGGGPIPAPGVDDVVVDPSRGAIALGSNLVAAAANGPVRATWYRPTAGMLGALGNEADIDPTAKVVVDLEPHASSAGLGAATDLGTAVSNAVTLWKALPTEVQDDEDRLDVEIRLTHADRIPVGGPISLAPADAGRIRRWRIVAPRGTVATIAGDLRIDLAGAAVELVGVYVTGDITVGPTLSCLVLRHVTMDPTGPKTLIVDPHAWEAEVRAERCLLGAIRADIGAFAVRVIDCVVDALGRSYAACGSNLTPAGSGTAVGPSTPGSTSGPELWTRGSTFAGKVITDAIDAQDCVFADGATALRHQDGCVRYSYVGADLPAAQKLLPTTFHCGPFPAPEFQTVGFEANGYYALRLGERHPLLFAAADGGEVGAYHHLGRSRRLERLRQRAASFVPLDVRAGVELARWED